VGVDHGGFDVFVAEQFLHGANVVAILEQVGGETVAEGVRGDAFVDFCGLGGGFDGFLESSFVDVVALGDAGAGVFREVGGGEEVLPEPFAVSVGVFFIQRVGKMDGAEAVGKVGLVQGFDLFEMLPQGEDEAFGQHGDAIIAAFAVADDDLVVVEVDVFDAKAKTFHKAQAAAIENLSHKFIDAAKVGNDGAGFVFGEDGGDAFVFFGAQGGKGGFFELDLEDVTVEEENGAEGLVLGGGGDFSFDDEVGDELVDFEDGHLAGMDADLSLGQVGVVIADIFAGPVKVGFFGARGVLFDAKCVAVGIEEFFLCHR